MSFFKKLFGGRSFADEVADADAMFEDERWADARLAYDRALERGGGDEAQTEHCEERIAACLDELAKARIEEADRLADEGRHDLAEVELQSAMELASDPAVMKQARRRLETMEQEDARQKAEGPEEMSDDDRWAVLAGNWNEDQQDEYDELGEPLREALLLLHDEEVESALEALEAILEDAEEPVYLYLEVGRARALAEDFEGAEEALRAFVDQLEEDEGGQAQLSAYAALAQLRERDDDEEGALGDLGAAMEAFPDEPGPFLMMGQYLFGKGHVEEAVEVLESGADLLDADRPDWRYLEQLGLAYAAAEEDEKAAATLDQVIAFFVSLVRHDRELDYPPATAVARAKLYEDEGRLEKAADLYRTLASGSDVANHLVYHREAARLLLELELDDEARRMLARALALAEGDDEAHAEIEAQLSELE